MFDKEFYDENIMCRSVESCDILKVCVNIDKDKLFFELNSDASNIDYYINNELIGCNKLKITTRGYKNINIFVTWLNTINDVISNGDGGNGGITNFYANELSNGRFRFYIDDIKTHFSSILDNLSIDTKGTSEPETFKSCCCFAELAIKCQLIKNKILNKECNDLEKEAEQYRKVKHDILDFDIDDEFVHIWY